VEINGNLVSNVFGQQTISGFLLLGDKQSDGGNLEKNKHK